MKRLLPLLALGLLAGCATYPQYGYYDDARYERYDDQYSDSDYYGYSNDGGDYYYGTQPDRGYYDGYYGSDYGYGYSSYGYSPYGYGGYGYGGYGYRPGLNIGLGYSFGNSYRRGSYPYYYSGGYRNYGYRGGTRDYGNHRDGRGNFRNEGDGSRYRDNDASDAADRLARERGVRDAEPRSYRGPDRNRPRESTSRNGWRSDYRDAQLASPRAAASGGFSRSAADSSQLLMQPIENRRSERRYQRSDSQALPRTPPVQTWRAGDRYPRGNAEAGNSRGRERVTAPQQSFAPAPTHSQSRAPAPRPQSGSSNSGARSSDSARSRDAEE